MKLIRILIFFLLFISVSSYGQQKKHPTFNLQNSITAKNNSPQIHSLWEGIKNPFQITCNNPTMKFLIHAEGGDVVNNKENHEFDLVPNQRNVKLVILSVNFDTLNVINLLSRSMIPPKAKLMVGSRSITNDAQIRKSAISDLYIQLNADTILKRDLLELPDFKVEKYEVMLLRNKRKILSVTSLSNINSITNKANSNDEIIILISTCTYKDAFSNTITKDLREVFRIKIQ